jgi:hypothetical protein
MSYALSAGLIGSLLAAFILYLIRRDQLYLRDAIFWLATALASIAFGLFPALIDWLGGIAGVAYAPALILALVCSVLTIKALLGDIALTVLRRDVRRLNQRVALIDAEQRAKSADSDA